MAERRMFSKSIVDSDKFLDMPSSAQNLYFHLGMRADDEGFVNNPKKIQKIIGASDDDVKILLAKKYLILFESGVIVVTHWKIHNYIQKDRFKPTNAISEKALISLDTSNVYTLDTKCIQDVSSLDTQVRLGKVSLGKDKLSPKSSLKENSKEEREDKKDFFKFLETTREKYKGNGINSFYPTLTFYFDKEIKVASNKHLYFAESTDYLSPSQAQEVWEYLFINPGALIPITKQGAAS
ncbi:MAG: replisome organizer [Sulfurovaceae bacterium]|nr:replisome organizer [Sulfurovaceae bacterium]